MMSIDKMIAFEEGELSMDDTLSLFSELISSGKVWSLQGFYGRIAKQLIDTGMIAPDGTISEDIDTIGGE
jgi:hypothetical protein